jgi:RNA polymerase sigma-70 factor (ECF subfamily)
VRDHGQQLIGLAARLVGRASAEDVAQEAFVRLAKRIEQYPLPEVMALLRSPSDLRRLMFRITACRAYEHLRRRYGRAQAQGTGELERALDEESLQRSQHDLELDISVDAIEQAYRTLPPMQRLAHVLHHCYGLTDSELAAVLETSPSNCRSLVFRATRALRRAMEMDP